MIKSNFLFLTIGVLLLGSLIPHIEAVNSCYTNNGLNSFTTQTCVVGANAFCYVNEFIIFILENLRF